MTRVRLASIASALVVALGLPVAVRADESALYSFGIGYFDQAGISPNQTTGLGVPSGATPGAPLGMSYLDLPDNDRRQGAGDLRLDYRVGTSLLSATEPWATIRPWAGVEKSSDGAVYGVSGLLVDVPLGSFVLTPSAGVGLYDSTIGKTTGSALAFRTQLELGYQFNSQSRLALSYSHISTPSPTQTNTGGTGTNFIGLYLHLPSSLLFGE